jgi:hypothetical protein
LRILAKQEENSRIGGEFKNPNGFAWLKNHGSKQLQNGIKMTNPYLTLNNKERKKEEIQQAFEEKSYHQLF